MIHEGDETVKIPKFVVLGGCFVLYGGTVFFANKFFNGGFDTLIFEILVVIGCVLWCFPLGLYIFNKHATNNAIIETGRNISTDWVRYDDLEDEENDNTENAENFQDNE
jgi:hypothetical protein